MLKVLRYALATICFATSVGCLALWWRSLAHQEHFFGPSFFAPGRALYLEASNSHALLSLWSENDSQDIPSHWQYVTLARTNDPTEPCVLIFKANGHFVTSRNSIFFPLWYPALIFALAGVAALRLGRRFTLRSAIIATTIVAGLLGMIVTL